MNDKKIPNKKPFQDLEMKRKPLSLWRILATLAVGYSVLASIPTFILVYVFSWHILIAQLPIVGLLLVCTWLFGWYKPATPEQLAKRDARLGRWK